MNVVGYARVSTEEQALEGISLEAQATAIERHAITRDEGWEIADIVREVGSGGTIKGRLMLSDLLDRLDDGEYDTLIVARLDRLSRSSLDFWMTVNRAERNGWALICLDPDVDMTTPFGRAMAGMAAIFAQLERELIAQRTREGIAAKKVAGGWAGGRPRSIEPGLEDVVRRLPGTQREVAAELNRRGIPSPTGGEWGASSVGMIRRRS